MKKEISPALTAAVIVIVAVAVAGIGYYVTFGGGPSYQPLPPAKSRAEMLGNLQRNSATGGAPVATYRKGAAPVAAKQTSSSGE